MGAASTPARICPECGTRNSGMSLFCAECGASLTAAASAPDDDSQTTITFRPTTGAAPDDPYSTQEFQPQSPYNGTGTATHPAVDAPADGTTDRTPRMTPEPESRRGLVLGWIAGILILLVIAWFGWTDLLDAGTRDSITGLFG